MKKIFLLLIISILFFGCVQPQSSGSGGGSSIIQQVTNPVQKTEAELVDEEINALLEDKDGNALTVSLLVLDELGYQNPQVYIDENIFVIKTTTGYMDKNALDEILFIMYELTKEKKEYWIYLFPQFDSNNVSYDEITDDEIEELNLLEEEIPKDISSEIHEVFGVDTKTLKDYMDEKITIDELIDNSYYRSYIYG